MANNPTKTTKPQAAQSINGGLLISTDDVKEVRAMYPRMHDQEIAELFIYLTAFPDSMRYLREQTSSVDSALQGARLKSIAFITAAIESIPRENPETETQSDGPADNAPRNSDSGTGR